MSKPTRYTRTAMTLHWLMALLIFAAFPLGVYMHELPLSPTKLQLYSYHKWIGVTLLGLIVLRIVWRLRHAPPPLPEQMPDWQKRASAATHHLLYLLLVAVPMSGWLMSSAKGFQTVWLGVLPLPDLVEKNKELGVALAELHEGLNIVLLVLVALHLAAVVKHQFIDRDDILSRMLPKGNRP
ncbi:MAG: cytochrome b [Nitrosomonadales bacterium]|nr:cytochrome b [Nitrosomonadales bacterium]